jgi:hypothetical protein
MISHLLGTEDIDRELEELVLEKTEGVPLFIEEFIKSLKDLKVIQRKDNKYGLASRMLLWLESTRFRRVPRRCFRMAR